MRLYQIYDDCEGQLIVFSTPAAVSDYRKRHREYEKRYKCKLGKAKAIQMSRKRFRDLAHL